MLELQKLKCDGQLRPLGIDNPHPVFSWQLQSEQSNIIQVSYQIKMIKSETEELIWDTGVVKSDHNLGVIYKGMPLESRLSYTWNLTVVDNQGQQAQEIAHFEMGFLEKNDWQAKWITPDLPGLPEDKKIGMLRATVFPPKKLPDMIPQTLLHKSFELPKSIKKARIYATAHGTYQIKINGKRLGNAELAPEFSAYKKILHYHTYDATTLLEKGDNAIGITISDGWYCGHIGFSGTSKQYGDRHALLMQIEIEYTDGTKETIISDESFKASNQGPIRYADLFIGECHDARMEISEFSKVGLNADGWEKVTVENHGFENLRAFYGEPIRRVKTFKPKSVITTPKGETVLDLGQNIVGIMNFRVKGEAGTTITLEHSETLDHKGNFLMNILGMNKHQRDTYILKGEGVEEFNPQFTFHGFQYVKVTGYPGKLNLDDFTAVVMASDLEKTGLFETSNADLNQLQSNIYWSQLGNMISIPTDCPQREKAGWTGDIQVYGPTAAFNQDVHIFLRRFMESVRAEQFENGEVPFVIPFLDNYRDEVAARFKMNSCAGWSDAVVIVPYDLYMRYGDLTVLEQNYDAMKNWMTYVEGEVASGRWNEQWHYGDWLIPSLTKSLLTMTESGKKTKHFVAVAYRARMSAMMAEIAKLLGHFDDVTHYEREYQSVKDTFTNQFIKEDGIFETDFQGMYVMALKFGLIPENLKPKYVARLARLIEENGNCLNTGFLSVPFLLDVLCANGLEELAYAILYQKNAPSWLYEVANKATTIWESYTNVTTDGKRRSMSYNHYSFGAVGDFMYRHIGGIDFLEPGYKKIKISPNFNCGLSFATTEFESVQGRVKTSWEIKEGVVVLEVFIPCNTTAVIMLNGVASKIESNTVIKSIGTTAEIEVGSGHYHFSFQLAR